MKYFRLILTLLALLITFLVVSLTGCQSKKKAMDIQKSATVQQSDVKKETSEVLNDRSGSNITFSDQSRSGVVEEWFYTDTLIVSSFPLKYRKTTYKNNDISSSEVLKSDIQKTSNIKLDSSGQSKTETKSKVQSKEVKDNLTGKAVGVGFLILVILGAVVYIRFQMKSV